jgi:hypothetical protein
MVILVATRQNFAKDDDLFRKAMKPGAEWREKANREGG